MIIADLMTVITAGVSPQQSLAEAVLLMQEKQCSCVLVTEDEYPKGIITERDVVRFFLAMMSGELDPGTIVAEVMTKEPACIQKNTSLYDALMLSRSRHLRHLLVVDDQEKLIGLVTQTDMVNAYMKLIERQSVLETENEELQLLSNQDPLMKIGNRRAMQVELTFTEASSRRYDKSYALALIDVDFFKKYNDHYGHQSGDSALQLLATTMQLAMRATDRLYRYGGEELLLLMPETTMEEARVAAERVRKAVEVVQCPHSESPLSVLTVSIGVAADIAQPWQQLVARADKALYRAKDSGRNRIDG
jgi:diguanylate cyclase (GGDEF)-like protein